MITYNKLTEQSLRFTYKACDGLKAEVVGTGLLMKHEKALLDKRPSSAEYPLMIQSIVTYECARCGSLDPVKSGHDYIGTQKYHCKTCGRYGILQAQTGYSKKVRKDVKRLALERVSSRGIERGLGLSRRTVSRWLAQWIA